MSELDELRDALKAQSVAPREKARQTAMSAALSAFDQKNRLPVQGLSVAVRLRIAARSALATLIGGRNMRMNPALLGGASVMALTIGVIATASLRDFGRSTLGDEGFSPAVPEIADYDANSVQPLQVPSPLEHEARSRATPTKPAVQQDLAQTAGGAATPPPGTVQKVARSLAAPAPMPSAARPASGQLVEQAASVDNLSHAYRDQGRDRFQAVDANPVKKAAEEPVSTFSIDVDTASYSFMRAALANGVRPQADAVRVEELINYFPYDYPVPDSHETPFRPSVTVMSTPWNPATKLLYIGIKGYEMQVAERARANLVFLLDTSGSMEEPNKLPLLVNSLRLLVEGLSAEDRVSIVTYAGSAGTVLEPTPASEKAKILAALDNLAAGGSTAGAEGIRQAYRLAEQNFDANAVNRVILATDGDFNVGITDPDELKSFVERQRESGVYLSVLGFGRGNYNDELMQALAQNGNGAAAYIDTLNEARKALVEEAGSTMFPIAKDVKLQVEFNPATVSEYRLIGYETRVLNREDFNNDRVDAGEIGAGHTVTALYEITPAGSGAELIDTLRYGRAARQATPAQPAPPGNGEYAFLKIRYKLPAEDESRLIERPVTSADETEGTTAREARFAAAVAAFGQLLTGGTYTGKFSYDDAAALAQANRGEDPFGYRAEFVSLVRMAKSASDMEPQRP